MTFNIDLYDLRRREVQALGAALSCRDWYMTEKAYNSLRDKLDNAGFTVSGPPTTPKPPAGGDAGAVERAYRQGQIDMRDRAAAVCDKRGAEEQESYGLNRAAQNYFRARNAVRDLEPAALALPAPVVEGWQEMDSAPNHDGAKIIGFDERWGVAEMMRDGSKLWVLASFNGQVIHCNPVRWQSTPTPPAALSEGRSHG